MASLLNKQFLHPIGSRRLPDTAGNKAHNLHRLIKKGILVPKTWVVGWEAFERYAHQPTQTIELLRRQLRRTLDLTKIYAVRSSASTEDQLEHSFAGQFATILNVQGESSIVEAICSVWASAFSPNLQPYLEKLPLEKRKFQMAVILQEMVHPQVSGISFSRNPISGDEEVIIEAVHGEGTALVQKGVTPFRWVKHQTHWISIPEDSSIDKSLIDQVAELTCQISAWFKMDVDLEWVYDGQRLFWVQMREITTLKNLTIYSNRIAKEVLPGMIKPLIWSINIPLVNKAWIKLLTELVGKNDLRFDDLAKSFHYRAYFNLTSLGRIWQALGMPLESLEILMGILPPKEGQRFFKISWKILRLMPRMLAFLTDKWSLADRFEIDYRQLEFNFEGYDWRSVQKMGLPALLAEIDRLEADLHDLAYYNIIVPILMAIYSSLFTRYLSRAGVDPQQFDYELDTSAYFEVVPDNSLKELQQDFSRLELSIQESIKSSNFQEFEEHPGISAFQEKVNGFIERFGHLSDSGNDFSAVPWREKPELVLNLITQLTATPEKTAARIRFENIHFPIQHRILARTFYLRARKFRLYREQVSSLYTYAYGLFRPYFLAVANQLTAQGILSEPDQVFYLYRDEIQEILEHDYSKNAIQTTFGLPQDIQALARLRKDEMRDCRDLKLPALIYGEVARPLDNRDLDKLTGIPTSRGYHSGPVKVVAGLEDSAKIQPGDVLVIPYSDIGWAPLIARAGAVIAESGGMLSHSSIIAREHQIPAVVSVTGAMDLQDLTLVTVDGFRGEILLHKEKAPFAV